ncbi:MAG: alpha-E domain-containing protein [Alphaproteobacteria bacterium]|tara:strand:- start:155 stop:1108 length:954 start_codon:yes stop_codon:yes gene_type:complete
MLSRTAENLFWFSRYIERADATIRLLEVGYRMSVMPNTLQGYRNEWEAILESIGSKAEYIEKNQIFERKKIEFFLLFDKRNHSSVINCITKARENIRLARTAVTLEVWNAINSSFHEFSELINAKYNPKNLLEIIDIVKRQVNTIRGTILNTQLLNDGYDFLTIGTYFERADFTARLIDVKYYILLPSSEDVGSQNDQFQWGMLLRSISSYRAYNWAYGTNEYSYTKIIDLLILNTDCPRSLAFSVGKISEHFRSLVNLYNHSSKAHNQAKDISKKLKNKTAEAITEYGLHEFLLNFLDDMNELYDFLNQKYFRGIQ